MSQLFANFEHVISYWFSVVCVAVDFNVVVVVVVIGMYTCKWMVNAKLCDFTEYLYIE